MLSSRSWRNSPARRGGEETSLSPSLLVEWRKGSDSEGDSSQPQAINQPFGTGEVMKPIKGCHDSASQADIWSELQHAGGLADQDLLSRQVAPTREGIENGPGSAPDREGRS